MNKIVSKVRDTFGPTISGTMQVGQTLTAMGWPGPYQWLREGLAISGATSSTYTLQVADQGCLIQVSANGVLSPLFGPVLGTTVFYVSSSIGNDSNPGTLAQPWKTLAKITNYSFTGGGFPAGTSILFKRGDKWDWSTDIAGPVIFFNNSGSAAAGPIVFDAYGIGPQPIIDGSIDASTTGAWTNAGTNLWQSAAQFLPPTQAITFGLTVNQAIVVHWNSIAGNFNPTNGNSCVFGNTGGSLPAGITAGQTYYIVGASGSDSNISATFGGAAINASSTTQTGTQLGGISGYPYFAANDAGNILWGFSPLGGTAPPSVMTASFGAMTGGLNTNGNFVWYKPGDGFNNIGTTQGNWNFNTDNFRVQIYCVGNPATTLGGGVAGNLRIVLDSGFLVLGTGIQYISAQNLTIQNAGASNMFKTQGGNIIIRDCVLSWIGGGNIGGGSAVGSRAGDMLDAEGEYINILVERIFCYQFYDDPIGPQLFTGTHHDNMTIRNCIFYKNDKPIELETSIGNMNGVYIYNNTSYPSTSWSANQRPNSGGAQWGFEVWPGSTLYNLDVRNNVFAGVANFGILLHSPLKYDFTDWATSRIIDYNNWKLLGSGNIQIAAFPTPPTQMAMGGGSGSWQSTYGFEAHGLIDIDPSFVSATNDFTPTPGSPLRNAGANLYAQGVVWDFFRKPRPPTGPFTIGAIQ